MTALPTSPPPEPAAPTETTLVMSSVSMGAGLPTGVPPGSLTEGLPDISLRPLPPLDPTLGHTIDAAWSHPEPAPPAAPQPAPQAAPSRVWWPLQGQDPRDLPGALDGVREIVAYLSMVTHPSSGISAVDADQLAALVGAVTEITTCLPALAVRLGDLVDHLGDDPTLTHTEAQRGDTAATVITKMLKELAAAEVTARALHAHTAVCRVLAAFLTHHHPEGHPHAA